MPGSSPLPRDVVTINYNLSWPHLENPSNTTFVGATQIDICRCGPRNTDLGHVYTRYRCRRPEVRFAPASEDLWVLQRPLGHINLLRPATCDEVQRRKEIEGAVEPNAYAGKNFLLLSGPCPRGRYQAYATQRFLQSLHVSRRQQVESLSLLIQPYEEDCSDNQGGRAYIDLARYIIEELPAFKTLHLHIWGEESKPSSREFAMVLWRDGVKIVVNWDWSSRATEEYTDVEEFLKGIDAGVVANKPKRVFEKTTIRHKSDTTASGQAPHSYSSSCESSSHPSGGKGTVIWQEVTRSEHVEEQDEDEAGDEEEDEEDAQTGGVILHHASAGAESQLQRGPDLGGGLDELVSAVESMDSGWSDAILSPVSPESASGREDGGWQVL
ncbi:hypothetical protein FB567DRAFT_543643 [Paraphoma chrysanthemicola]|uniref:Uncharacterized protein n=1 Tax=Paraphoma chrysanthemicola TaxID=798071 RepID=A0A8K0W4X5_9PLEO|nr:hypothetical protein FB567DRAFT_543643 [Paraphoma chrysanthemicola]